MSVAEQAARWAVRLEQADKATHAQFARWLRQSPLHIQEYLLLTAVDRELDGIDLRDIDTVALSAALRSSTAPTAKTSRSRRYPLQLALAASVIATVMAGWWFLFGPGTVTVYKTGVGEQRKLALADGTIVQLEPLSRLEANLSERSRDIELLAGEASFHVHHDIQRPFRVRAQQILIEDIGTLFRVHRRASGMVVSVVEGAVDVSAHSARAHPKTRINAGEQARIGADGRAVQRQKLQPEPVSSLQRRRLLFNGDTLTDIVEDFNRYNHSARIRVESDRISALRFSGSFDADDPASLVEYLQKTTALQVIRVKDEWVVRQR